MLQSKKIVPIGYNLLFLVCILMGVIGFLATTHASVPQNSDWDDAMFSSLWFQEVPDTIQKESGNRFIWNQNHIKRAFINNSK